MQSFIGKLLQLKRLNLFKLYVDAILVFCKYGTMKIPIFDNYMHKKSSGQVFCREREQILVETYTDALGPITVYCKANPIKIGPLIIHICL